MHALAHVTPHLHLLQAAIPAVAGRSRWPNPAMLAGPLMLYFAWKKKNSIKRKPPTSKREEPKPPPKDEPPKA